MNAGVLHRAYARLSRIGLAGLDRQTARFVMGNNHYVLFAVSCAVPFVVALFLVDGGKLWPAALVHLALTAAWASCLWLHLAGLVRTSAVLALVAPLVGYSAQTYLLSSRAGFLLPMLLASAVSFVTMGPWMMRWRVGLTLASSAALAWSLLDDRLWVPRLDVSQGVLDGLLIANIALSTVVIGLTSWLNDHYFTRERRRADARLTSAQEEARTDALTNLANRRAVTEVLDAMPHDKPYAVALLDIDNFKEVNDTRGHAFGDAVLAAVADVLERQLGPYATVARWGGEEFLVIQSGTRLTAAVRLVERTRKEVERAVAERAQGVRVTFSAGVAAAPGGLPWEVAVRVADALLYEAKEAGRNRIRYAQVRTDLSGGDS